MSDLTERELEETGDDKEQSQQAQELSESELEQIAAAGDLLKEPYTHVASDIPTIMYRWQIWEKRAKAAGFTNNNHDIIYQCPACGAEDHGHYSVFSSLAYDHSKCFNFGCNYEKSW